MLTGLGSPTFTRALQMVREIHARFDRQFNEDELEKMQDQPGEGESEGIGFWNRYFTPAREAGGATIPFLAGTDPRGILRDMARAGSYVHTEDNVVRYYEAYKGTKQGSLQCVPNFYKQ
jgi:hypothetical protein